MSPFNTPARTPSSAFRRPRRDALGDRPGLSGSTRRIACHCGGAILGRPRRKSTAAPGGGIPGADPRGRLPITFVNAARHLSVTLGKNGLVAFDRQTHDHDHPDWSARLLNEHLPSFADRSVDRLGYGDALLAAATLTLATGTPLMHAAYLGNAAAALEIAKLGNLPIDGAPLRRWISRPPELAASVGTPTLVSAV